jgi:phage terminase large subunit-like protein
VVLGGRGAGKTRAGAEWVRAQVEGRGPKDEGSVRRVALVGETYDQAVAVMVKGKAAFWPARHRTGARAGWRESG